MFGAKVRLSQTCSQEKSVTVLPRVIPIKILWGRIYKRTRLPFCISGLSIILKLLCISKFLTNVDNKRSIVISFMHSVAHIRVCFFLTILPVVKYRSVHVSARNTFSRDLQKQPCVTLGNRSSNMQFFFYKQIKHEKSDIKKKAPGQSWSWNISILRYKVRRVKFRK